MKDTIPDWSSLPEDLLVMIAKRLQTRIDKQSFGAVCNSFRSAATSLLKLSPSLLKLSSSYQNLEYFPYGSTGTGNYVFHLEITESFVYAIEPISAISNIRKHSKPWLIKLEESSSGKRQIRNLIFEDTPKELRKKTLNLLHYRLTELSKACKFDLVLDEEFDGSWIYRHQGVVSTNEDETSALMAIVNDDLVVWRGGNKKGTRINLGFYGPPIHDIIFHNEKFYVLTYKSRVLTVDPKSLNVNEVVATEPREWTYYFWAYFAKAANDLFLIMYYAPRLVDDWVYVFKLDDEMREWSRVKDGWEDRALLLGMDGHFFVFAKEFSDIKCSCIYSPIARDAMIFNLKDKTGVLHSHFPDYFKIFWPPPAWL